MRNRRINLFCIIGILFLIVSICGFCFTCLAASEKYEKSVRESYSADKLTYSSKSGVTVLEGNAKLHRSDGDYMYADQITMYEDTTTKEMIKTVAVGNVEMKEKDMAATCNHAIFYEKEERIEFKGTADKPAVVDTGNNRMEAPFIIYFRKDKRVEATGFLFSVGMEFQSDLDNGAVSEDLRKEFEKNGIALSDTVSVSKDESDAGWSITDGEKIYIIEKKEDELDVNASGGVQGQVTVEVKEDESEEEAEEK